MGRAHRRAFSDQVSWRPWQFTGRRDRGIRNLRLDEKRQISNAVGRKSLLSRDPLPRDLWRFRLLRGGKGARAPRSRLMPVAAKCISGADRNRNAAAPNETALRKRF